MEVTSPDSNSIWKNNTKSILPTPWLSANTVQDLTSAYIRYNLMHLISVSNTSRSIWSITCLYWKKHLTSVVEHTGISSISLPHCVMSLCHGSTIKDWYTQTALLKIYTIIIKLPGVKTFQYYISPAATGHIVPVYSMGKSRSYYRLKYILTFLK